MFNTIRTRRGFSYIEMTLSVTLMAVFMVATFSKLGSTFDSLAGINADQADDVTAEEIAGQFEGLGINGGELERILAELTTTK
jgi:Flp pilus assembly pilin Flp